ncbi:hypothetical protein J7K93_12875 [bacterium]|nr:hypothetical protein [bacterium]
MNYKLFFRITIICISVLLFLFGCQKKEIRVSDISLKPVLTWGGVEVQGESMIGGISDFIISSKDEIICLDDILCQIFYFNKEGKLIKKTGNKGKGPLEFIQPLYIEQIKDTLYIWDSGNGRFQNLTLNGKLIKTLIPKPQFDYNPIAHKADGGFFCGSEGFRSDSLIQVYDYNAKIISMFGRLEGNKIEYYEFTTAKIYTKKKKIPPFEKNKILLCYTSDHNLMVIHQAIPFLKKFNEDGNLIFKRRLQSPVFAQLESNFYAANDSLPGYAFQLLRYWKDVIPDGSGGIYLLLNNPSKMIVHHYNKNGVLIERLTGPEDNISLIYFKNNRLWAYGEDSLLFYIFNI